MISFCLKNGHGRLHVKKEILPSTDLEVNFPSSFCARTSQYRTAKA